MDALPDRWPPIYDFEELAQTIQQLVDSADLAVNFYDRARVPVSYFQGDIIRFRTELPFLDHEGQPAAEEAVDFWMVLGNTCDLVREVTDVPWAQIIPVWDLGGTSELPPSTVQKFAKYRYYKQFYVPPWDAAVADRHHVADFLRPVTIHKLGLGRAAVLARLTFQAWVLFHSCVVRFLARDDRRGEAG